MITYSYIENTNKNVLKIKVLLDGKIIGEIIPVDQGWTYFPKKSKNPGVIFKTFQLVMKSLEAC